ncbi:MAG: ferredoxin family protein [Methanomassiliicoccales archaeon]
MAVKKWSSEELGLDIEIDYDLCVGHGDCVEECPTDVYELQDGKAVVVDIDECIECCVCVDACPEGAIKHSSC